MKMIITGHKGNLGSTLTELAKAQGHIVYGIGKNNWSDLASFLKESDLIIHCAWDLKNKPNKNPVNLIKSNLSTTSELLEKLKNFPNTKLIYISSCAVYGNVENTEENQRCSPVDFNGTLKSVNEQLIKSFSQENNINYTIIRLFNTFGNQDKFSFLYHLASAIKNGKEFTMFNDGESSRDFIHVNDVAKILLKIIDSKTTENIINIGTGKAVVLKDIINKVKDKFPNLKVNNATREEIKISQADTTKLKKIYIENFESIFDYISDYID